MLLLCHWAAFGLLTPDLTARPAIALLFSQVSIEPSAPALYSKQC